MKSESQTTSPSNSMTEVIEIYQSVIKDMNDLFNLIYDTLDEDSLLRGTIHISIMGYKEQLEKVNEILKELNIALIMSIDTGLTKH